MAAPASRRRHEPIDEVIMMADRNPRNAEQKVPGRPLRRGFHIALGAYVLWLIFLAVLAVMQRRL